MRELVDDDVEVVVIWSHVVVVLGQGWGAEHQGNREERQRGGCTRSVCFRDSKISTHTAQGGGASLVRMMRKKKTMKKKKKRNNKKKRRRRKQHGKNEWMHSTKHIVKTHWRVGDKEALDRLPFLLMMYSTVDDWFNSNDDVLCCYLSYTRGISWFHHSKIKKIAPRGEDRIEPLTHSSLFWSLTHIFDDLTLLLSLICKRLLALYNYFLNTCYFETFHHDEKRLRKLRERVIVMNCLLYMVPA